MTHHGDKSEDKESKHQDNLEEHCKGKTMSKVDDEVRRSIDSPTQNSDSPNYRWTRGQFRTI